MLEWNSLVGRSHLSHYMYPKTYITQYLHLVNQ